MATVAFKVASLAIRQLAKPVAATLEKQINNSPAIRRTVLSIADVLHRANVQITRAAEGKSGKVFVGKMNEGESLKLASTFASETFMFSVAAGLMYMEYSRNSAAALKKEQEKEEQRKIRQIQFEQEKEVVNTKLLQLEKLIESMDDRLNGMTNAIVALNRVVQS